MHRRGAYGSRARRSRAYYLRIFYVPRRPTRSASVSRRRTFAESLLATLCTRSMLLLSPPSLLSLSLWTALPYPFPFSTLDWNWTGINENGVVYLFFFAGYKATSFFYAQAREKKAYIYIHISYFIFLGGLEIFFFFFSHTISYHKYNSKSNSL